MNILQATRSYEVWLAHRRPIVRTDVVAKHRLMARDPFSFFRATFYRWTQLFPALCPTEAAAPRLLSVGDLHVENYGTWRDMEGRLIWGINDFDEACSLPYTNDLVRLAASAWLAIASDQLSTTPKEACKNILDGYMAAVSGNGRPFVLSEGNRQLRIVATSQLRDPVRYWRKIEALPDLRRVPRAVMSLLRQSMPGKPLPFRVVHRPAGIGSLGRQRFTAIAEWRGGKVAREVKALPPSASLWASGPTRTPAKGDYQNILSRGIRALDPYHSAHNDRWVIRRLSPYCSRIELRDMPRERDEHLLLRAMGTELANIHLGAPRATSAAVRRDLRRRKRAWLFHAAKIMVKTTLLEWREWSNGVKRR